MSKSERIGAIVSLLTLIVSIWGVILSLSSQENLTRRVAFGDIYRNYIIPHTAEVCKIVGNLNFRESEDKKSSIIDKIEGNREVLMTKIITQSENLVILYRGVEHLLSSPSDEIRTKISEMGAEKNSIIERTIKALEVAELIENRLASELGASERGLCDFYHF